MRAIGNKLALVLGLAGFFVGGNTVLAGDAGLLKTVKGGVRVERDDGISVPRPGTVVMVSDRVITGADGSIGIALQDGTLLSAGPNSILTLNKFVFDTTTAKGELDATLKKGTLSVISGKISKISQDAVTYRTPNAILGVRGTEFIIDAN